MKKFRIKKEVKKDYQGNTVLIIKISQLKACDQWKNRYMLFNCESMTYKNFVKNCK